MSESFLGACIAREKPLFWEVRYDGVGQCFNKSPMLVVRRGNWKLLFNPDGSRTELYDIPNQPMETDSRHEEHPELVNELRELALTWQKTLPPGPVTRNCGGHAYAIGKPPLTDEFIKLPEWARAIYQGGLISFEEFNRFLIKAGKQPLTHPVEVEVTERDMLLD